MFNYFFIPVWGYTACAIATLLCYGFMMTISYLLGQKHYPVPYAWPKLLGYILITIIIFALHQGITMFVADWMSLASAIVLLILFLLFVGRIEKKEFSRFPLIGRFYKLPLPAAQVVDKLKA
jgi:peptidoglycan biosynthesis protein MviN/MurJ (putative lipid II flippase)